MRGLILALAARVPPPLRASLCYAAAMVWTKGLAFVTVPLLTAMLDPAEFGRLELLSSAAEIGGLIAGAGLVDTLFRFASGRDGGHRAAAEVSGLALLVAGVVIAAISVGAPMLAHAMPLATTSGEIMLLGTAVALESAIGVPLGWLRLHGRAGAWALLTGLRATAQAAIVVALVATGHGVAGVLWGGCLAAILTTAVLAGRQARETGIVLAPRSAGRLLAYGVPLIGSGLASFVLGTADRWLLAGSVSAASLGHYGLAVKIAMIVALLAQPFELWWYPRRLALLGKPDGLARSSHVLGNAASLLLLAGAATALVGPWLISLLAPASYSPARAMVPPLVLALVCQLGSSMANAGCYTRSTGSLPLMVNATAAAIALALYLLLIPPLGVNGAIVATVAAQAARLAIFAVISHRTVPIAWPAGHLARVALAACATGTLPLLLHGSTGALAGLAFLLLTAGLVLAQMRLGGVAAGFVGRLPRLGRAWRAMPLARRGQA